MLGFTRVRRHTLAASATAVALAVVLAGCSSDGDSGKDAAKDAGKDTSNSAGAFPVSIKSSLGTAEIKEKPQRIVTLGQGSAETAIALGQTPVGIESYPWGSDKSGYLPWINEAVKKSGDKLPKQFTGGEEIDFEAITELEPDVILAPWSGITQKQYDVLKDIAPRSPTRTRRGAPTGTSRSTSSARRSAARRTPTPSRRRSRSSSPTPRPPGRTTRTSPSPTSTTPAPAPSASSSPRSSASRWSPRSA